MSQVHIDEIQEHVVYPRVSHRNCSVPELIEVAIKRGEAQIASPGAIAAVTAPRTGRSPNDKFIVKAGQAEELVWWGPNQPFLPEKFDLLFARFAEYIRTREAFVFNGYAGADPQHRLPVRIITEFAWHNIFAHQLFIRPTPEELKKHRPAFRVICMPGFFADPQRDGTRSEAFVIVSFRRKMVIIGGTRYAGEIKKSIFSVMNYLMPQQGVLPMHCSANLGSNGDVALFFGLSGTGKTTLSADPKRRLIGDDEHGWGENGVFNFEGGCYAKCVNLNAEKEPQIWNAIRFGSVLENVMLDERHCPDYEDTSITENSRVAYPIEFIKDAVIPGIAGHPKNVVFLTADATGVLPPIAKLTEPQAMFHFLSGYTSKLAGTETGITQPVAVFSACFGAPFLPLPPSTYADMLGEKLKMHNAACYLVNTGWSGGPYGIGHRIKLEHTRAIISAILDGSLERAKYTSDPIFGLNIPDKVNDVPSEILDPKSTWADSSAYNQAARNLAGAFRNNFEKFSRASDLIKGAAPKG
jgi:phosphoenolpyruvate carboxykinase (ATP)